MTTIVRFTQSNIEGVWTTDDVNLLEFAERHKVDVSFGCRHGVCGSCKVRFEAGQIKPLYRSGIDLDDDEVLLCCSVPLNEYLELGI